MITVARLESYKLWRHPFLWGLLLISFSLLSLFFYRLCVDYLHLANEALMQRETVANLTAEIVKPLCSWAMVILALFLPIFTTYAISQEYRHHTFYLWATSPFSARAFVWGKFLSLFFILLFLPAYLLLLISALSLQATLNWGNIGTALIAISLIGSCFISFGLFVSSLISSPLLAIGVTLLGNLFWILLEWINPFGEQGYFLASNLSVLNHSYHLFNGLIYSTDLIYYLLFNLFWLMLTERIIHSKMVNGS